MGLLLGFPLLCGSFPALARRDVRLALLVANQEGWVRDPRLNYVVSGDLQPMKRKLEALGFTVHAALSNKGPDAIRRAWKSVRKRLAQKPRVTTFFFYYSGHADKRYFHAGPKGKNPLSYTEFAQFLGQIQVRRRFVLIDACFSGELLRQFGSRERYRTLMQKGLLAGKGVERKLSFTDLRKHFPNQGEQVRGLQILSSSRFLSYESKKRRGSVFTYHFLRGLQGAADLDRDGKISFNELFLYVKPRVRGETGQSPQQWLFRVGSETYGFAPVYNSMLQIDRAVTGELQVRVEGFVWRWQKRKKRSLRLAVSTGYGQVLWRKQNKCFKQQLYFPPGGMASLSNQRWMGIDCTSKGFIKKGDAILPMLSRPLFGASWSMAAQAGLWGTTGLLDADSDLGGIGWFGLRHPYFGVFLGGGGSQSQFPFSGTSYHLLVAFRGEGGYRWDGQRLNLFVGVYLQVGLLMQDIVSQQTSTLLSLSPQGGGTLALAYRFLPRWSIVLAGDAGIVPRLSGVATPFFFTYSVRLGLRVRLGKSAPRF